VAKPGDAIRRVPVGVERSKLRRSYDYHFDESVVSFTLLENIYSTNGTHDNRHMMIVIYL